MLVKLSDIATYSQGKQVEIDQQFSSASDGLRRFIRIVDYTNPSEPPRYVEDFGTSYFVNKDDLVVIRYGSQTAGRIVRGLEGIIANNMFKINFKKPVNKSFLYYYLSRDEIYNKLRMGQSSSTMPAITFSVMDNIEIPIFDEAYQSHIVNINHRCLVFVVVLHQFLYLLQIILSIQVLVF